MKIAGDNRVISHFFRDEKSAVYMIVYPPQHSLKERIDMLEDLLTEMKIAQKREDDLKAEHNEAMKNGEKKDFETWLKDKFEKERKTQEEKAKLEEVKEVPVEEVKPEIIEDKK